jgi:hypothetical protein
MKKPLIRRGSNSNRLDTYVSVENVRKALVQLKVGHVQSAIQSLRKLCPEVPDLPPFEIA